MRCLNSTPLRWRHRYFYCGDYLNLHPRRGIKKGIGVFAETLISLKWPNCRLAWCWRSPSSPTIPACPHAGAGTGRYRRDVPVLLTVSGWLGVFLTGSDTSSNALFGYCNQPRRSKSTSLTLCWWQQHQRRRNWQDDLPAIYRRGLRATGMVGRESELFRYTVKHSRFLPALSALSRCCRRMCLLGVSFVNQ